MAVIQKSGNFMGLPMNIARGNPIPLDKSEIWYSYEEMAEYAKNNAVAYVGQVLGLVDENNLTAHAYIILNTNGDLQEIGSILVDNASVVLNSESQIALKNYGVQYYKYVPEVGTEGEEDYTPATYVLQVVDEDHPWKVGLEPKIAIENNNLVLGWYEPNPTTIDGVNSQVASLQSSVSNLQNITLGIQGSLKEIYTKTETDTKIAEAVAAADHLSRVVVNDVDAILLYEDKEKYIFMIPTDNPLSQDSYDEYIVINGAIEKVGSWETDLSGYATKADLDTKVDKVENYGLISNANVAKLESLLSITSVDDNNLKVESGKLTLVGVSNLQSILANKVDKEEGKGLSTNDLTDERLQLIQTNTFTINTLVGQVTSLNKLLDVQTTEDNEQVSNTIIKIQQNIANLNTLLNANTDEIATLKSDMTIVKTNVGTLQSDMSIVKSDIASLKSVLENLEDTYVTIEVFNSTVGNLDELLDSEQTIQEQIEEIRSILVWGEIKI